MRKVHREKGRVRFISILVTEETGVGRRNPRLGFTEKHEGLEIEHDESSMEANNGEKDREIGDLRSIQRKRSRETRGSDADATKIGKTIILPSSFSAVPRYMAEKYLDTMAICCWYGKPHLCITVAANPNWVELRHHLGAYGGESTNSRLHLE
ncbi:hypothetical protein YC2023_066602 [Brassica napus]